MEIQLRLSISKGSNWRGEPGGCRRSEPTAPGQGRERAQPHGTLARTGQEEPQDGAKPLCPAMVHSPFPRGLLHRLALTQEPCTGQALPQVGEEKQKQEGESNSLLTFTGSTRRCREANAGCPHTPAWLIPCQVCWGTALIPRPLEKSTAFPAPPSLEVFQERPDTDYD